MKPADEAPGGRLGGPALALVVLVAGVVTVLVVYLWLRADQRGNAERVMDQRTAVALSAVQSETERYLSLTQSMAAGISTDEVFTWDDFDAASAPLAEAGLAGRASVAFVVPASTAEIPAVQKLWRSRGADGLVLHPDRAGREHYFTIFTRQLGGTVSPVNGLDLAGAIEPADALVDARQLGRTTVSDTYILLRDRNLPAAAQQLSFVFAAPIFTRAPIPEFRGWVVLGLRGQNFVTGLLATVSQGQLDAQLLARNRDNSQTPVASYVVGGHPTLERVNPFTVADQHWTLVVRADPHRLPGAHSVLPLAVLIGGLFITVMLAGLVYTLATGRARAWSRVQKATAESRRQAGLLGAVMNSIGDGVGVIDENGRFLLHNPAAKQLLGMGLDSDDPGQWQAHYGIYRPDGRTPFPVAELPIMRSLSGESSDGVELVIRNPSRPEGILISVDSRPLDPSAGQPGAVAVFHDITEVRRYENDLSVFAGVVAHDLKAPLSVVRGHCENARDDLADREPAEVDAALVRIIRATDRMAGLIDTLLAYSTARDAPLRLTDVDLGALAEEVVQDRIAHLSAERRPLVKINTLPAVRADPAMLRHVLDNLVGNALKYVKPGVTPAVSVVSERVDDVWVSVGVADEGIGIPDADKPDVFERFHRSASSAASYAGTGLGLAICKRIVERHGGTIGVTDNPGGGSLFYFTIPAAGVSPERTRQEAPGMGKHEEDDLEVRVALERALAERADMERSRLPGWQALPSSVPSAHEAAAARLRAPVPDHQHEH